MKVSVKHRVNFYDTDAMAVVHHANYIRWFEIGRVEFLRAVGITLNEMMEDGYLFPIVEITAKYHSSAVFDDVVVIEVTPTALTKAKMAFSYQLFNEATGTLLVSGSSTNVFTNKATGGITRLPAKYVERLEKGME